ncbi:hypothetical protein [Nocardia brasiliensis]|uniref:hypothetical protein n=1 Tax=Nocardia brasiliensis TaxID=37326 RepID=UPI00366AF518
MTDRSPEDELIAEAVKFGRSFQQMLRLHAQAGNWLERRRIRKQISQTLREQRRTEQAARDHQLGWTQQMVDRYRVHAATVADRAINPNVDHERRYRDARSLAEHADYLRAKIIANPRLSPIEQGIALDGLDAATAFPQFEPERLFDRAHRVKGREALRYRAQVARAREAAGIEKLAVEPMRHVDRTISATDSRARQTFGPSLQGEAGEAWRRSHAAALAHEDLAAPGAWIADEDLRPAHEEQDVEQDLRRSYERELFAWQQAERELAPLRARDDQGSSTGVAEGEPRDAGNRLQDRIESQSQPRRADRFAVHVGPTAGPGHTGDFDDRTRAYDWTLHVLGTYHDTHQGQPFTASITERGSRDGGEVVDGPIGMVTDEIRALREQHIRNTDRNNTEHTTPTRTAEQAAPRTETPDSRIAQVERQLTDMAADRDRLGSRVEVLQRGLDAVTADRDEIRRKLTSAEGQIEALKNRNQRLAAEIGELRDRPGVDAVAAERDRYKRERDEAVTKLAQQTPREQRYGSRERVEFDKLGDTQRWSHATPTDETEPPLWDRSARAREEAVDNLWPEMWPEVSIRQRSERRESDVDEAGGNPRSSREASTGENGLTDADLAARKAFDKAIVEQMSADFAKVHGEIYDELKLREFAREWLTNAANDRLQQRGSRSDGAERNGQRRNGTERSR